MIETLYRGSLCYLIHHLFYILINVNPKIVQSSNDLINKTIFSKSITEICVQNLPVIRSTNPKTVNTKISNIVSEYLKQDVEKNCI